MRQRLPLLLIVLLAIALLAAGCSKTRTDAQIASDAQSKIGADPAITSKQQVSVQAANGVVTLSGAVTSDAERNAAATDAAGVEGVKTVVNNLTVQAPQMAQLPPVPQQQPAATAPPAPAAPATRQRPSRGESSGRPSAQRSGQQGGMSGGNETLGSGNQQSAAAIPPPTAPAAPVTPAPPPPPSKFTIPSGTAISVRLNDTLDSEKNKSGDTFRATLNSPIMVDEHTAIPADAQVQGHVIEAQSAGKFAGAGKLAITLDRISYGGQTYNIQTNQWSRQSTGRGKNTAAKVGGGAALGAIIGGLVGGGKGAAIGAGVGAGAGTGVQAATHQQQVKLSPEALVSFQLQQPITVTAPSGGGRRALGTGSGSNQ